jgi:hypothetical protein
MARADIYSIKISAVNMASILSRKALVALLALLIVLAVGCLNHLSLPTRAGTKGTLGLMVRLQELILPNQVAHWQTSSRPAAEGMSSWPGLLGPPLISFPMLPEKNQHEPLDENNVPIYWYN